MPVRRRRRGTGTQWVVNWHTTQQAHLEPRGEQVTGAGVIMCDHRGAKGLHVLLVKGKHSGLWSFPKGLFEQDEHTVDFHLWDTARREFKEEVSAHCVTHAELPNYVTLACPETSTRNGKFAVGFGKGYTRVYFVLKHDGETDEWTQDELQSEEVVSVKWHAVDTLKTPNYKHQINRDVWAWVCTHESVMNQTNWYRARDLSGDLEIVLPGQEAQEALAEAEAAAAAEAEEERTYACDRYTKSNCFCNRYEDQQCYCGQESYGKWDDYDNLEAYLQSLEPCHTPPVSRKTRSSTLDTGPLQEEVDDGWQRVTRPKNVVGDVCKAAATTSPAWLRAVIDAHRIYTQLTWTETFMLWTLGHSTSVNKNTLRYMYLTGVVAYRTYAQWIGPRWY